MKQSFLLTLSLVIGLTGSTLAQQIPDRPEGPPPPPHHQQRAGGHDRMAMKELGLTDAQKQAFKTQRADFKQRMEALKKQDELTVKEWKSRLETLRKEHQTALQKILTPEQQAKMKQLRKAAGDKQLQRMKEQLNLTEEQTAQIKQQRAAAQKQMQAIRENKKLSTDQKKEAAKKLMKEQKEGLQNLLTEEQKKKWKTLRPQGPKGAKHRGGMPPPPAPEDFPNRPKQIL